MIKGIVTVVDKATGKPIDGASIARRSNLKRTGTMSGYSLKPLPRRKTAGEFDYHGPIGEVEFNVVAQGYVPLEGGLEGTVDIPRSTPFKHEIRLTRGGEVRVVFKGLVSGKSLDGVSLVERVGAHGFTWLSLTVEENMARRDGLLEGEYAIAVRAGLNYEPVSDTCFRIEAGKIADLEIVVVPRDRMTEDWVDVRGTVVFHEAWSGIKSEVTFVGCKGRNRTVRESAELGRVVARTRHAFSLGRLPVGHYMVEVSPQWRKEIEVTAVGGSFDFKIPEPATLVVRVVAERTGKLITDADVEWYSKHVGSIRGRWFETYAESDTKPGEFRILAVPGRIHVTASGPGRVSRTVQIPSEGWTPGPPALKAGKTTVLEMRLPAAGSVAVNFRCNGRPVAATDIEAFVRTPPVSVRNEEGGSAIPRSSFQLWQPMGSGPRRMRDGLPTGTLVLRVRDSSGLYKPVPEREVKIKAGKTEEVVIDLIPVD